MVALGPELVALGPELAIGTLGAYDRCAYETWRCVVTMTPSPDV
jgi:hypothetical protein